MEPESPGLPQNLSPQEELETLKKRQAQFQSQQKYVQADLVQRRIDQLLQSSSKYLTSNLKSKQSSQLKILQSSYKQQLAQFNSSMEEQLKKLRQKHQSATLKLKNRQKQTHNKEKAKLETTIPVQFKPSSHLLNMIECKEKAVKRKQYLQADALKKSIDQMRVFQQNNYSNERSLKIKQQLKILDQQFAREKQHLDQRQKIALDQFRINRNQMLETLEKKYANLRRDLTNNQLIEMNIATGKQTSGVGGYSPGKFRSNSVMSPDKKTEENKED